MKVVLCVLAALVAMALGDRRGHSHGHGYDNSPLDPNNQKGLVPSHKGVTAPYRNADRQKAVNRVAHKYGTGTGTAYKDGVAGAGSVYLHNYGQYDRHGYGGHGHGHSAGYGGHGHSAGYGGHGHSAGYGGHGHSAGYGGHGHSAGYGGHGHSAGYGGHGHSGYGHGHGYANRDGTATRAAYNHGGFGPDSYNRHGSYGHGSHGVHGGHGSYGNAGYGYNANGHATRAAYKGH